MKTENARAETDWPRWLLAAAGALVLAGGWALWSRVLAPPEERDTSRVNAAGVTQRHVPPTRSVSPMPADSGEKKTGPRAGAAPLRVSSRVTAEDLHAALVGEGAVPGEVLLTFRSAQDLAAFRTRAGLYGLKILNSDARLLAARVAYSDLGRLADEINEHSGAYENVAANLVARIPGLPQAPPERDAANQGGLAPFMEKALASIGAGGDRSNWGKGVKVAVLDSGIGEHETFSGVSVEHVKLVQAGPEANGHGTSMASLISGRKPPAEGVAPAAQIIDVWVADEKGMSNTALVAQGIMEAVDRGAKVINISLGSFGSSLMLQNAVQHAMNNNVIIVAAAGNEQLNQLAYPAAYPGVVSVGAVDAARKQAYFSNSGRGLMLSAPGVGIVSAFPGGQVVIGSGTSQATALTTGAVAALLARGHSAAEVVRMLKDNAAATGAPQEQVGAGFLQIPPR